MSETQLIGKLAPKLSLPDANGEMFELEPGLTGGPVALFFYPKSGSMGCNMEACSFRDAIVEIPTFKASNVRVIGISGDSVEKQKAFVEKQKLTYPVLSDESGEGRKAYGVGRGFFGISDSARVTFVIDSKGIVRDTLNSLLNVTGHAKFVKTWLDKLEAEENAELEADAT